MAVDDDAYRHLANMLNGLEDAIRLHRDVVFRAISQLNREVIGFQQRLDRDDEDRASRQVQVDAKFQRIEDGQAQLRTWQWVRIVVEVVGVLIVVAFVIGWRL